MWGYNDNISEKTSSTLERYHKRVTSHQPSSSNCHGDPCSNSKILLRPKTPKRTANVSQRPKVYSSFASYIEPKTHSFLSQQTIFSQKNKFPATNVAKNLEKGQNMQKTKKHLDRKSLLRLLSAHEKKKAIETNGKKYMPARVFSPQKIMERNGLKSAPENGSKRFRLHKLLTKLSGPSVEKDLESQSEASKFSDLFEQPFSPKKFQFPKIFNQAEESQVTPFVKKAFNARDFVENFEYPSIQKNWEGFLKEMNRKIEKRNQKMAKICINKKEITDLAEEIKKKKQKTKKSPFFSNSKVITGHKTSEAL